MMGQTNLLKEYIKTLIASKPVFPGILPRQWGKAFSEAELSEVYLSLKSVIKLANPYTQESLIREFESFDYSPQHLRWYMDRFWREIVALLDNEPNFADRYPVKLHSQDKQKSDSKEKQTLTHTRQYNF